MDIIIQSLGFKASAALEDFVREKMEKIEHHADNIIRANVTLFGGPDNEPENRYCEIRLEVRGQDPFVKKSAATYEQAVSAAVDALDMVMQKNKDKAVSARQANREDIDAAQ